MRITLSKKVKLKTAKAYLRFQKEEDRKDIQEYLNRKQYVPLIENRLKDYLKNIGVFDEQFLLTKLGNSIKESGKMYVNEEGKYQIWFTHKDSFFKNAIFYFIRLQPNSKDEIRDQISLDSKEHFLLPTSYNGFNKLNLLSTEIFGEIFPVIDEIQFLWRYDKFLNKNFFLFKGILWDKEKKIEIKNDEIPTESDIYELIPEFLPEWNNQQERYSIRFDTLGEENIRTFEKKSYSLKWRDFDVQIQNLPLMPYDKEEAKKWRNWLLNEELKRDYFSTSAFEETAKELNEKKALATFSLDIPQTKDFIEKTDSKIVFWHLNAPEDLNPNTKVKLSLRQQHIELRQGDNISFADIVAKLGFDNSSVFLYYDRFVYNHNQQRAVSALAKAVNSPKKIVVTDLTPKDNSSDFIQNNVKEITMKDYKTIFKGRSPHDRYLISSNQNEISIWNISNSIDYISFSDKIINETTVGTVRQSVVFTPISKEMLDKDLLNFINNETKNGK